MKLLFVHDHKFRKVNNRLYSTGGLSNEVLSRYSKYATHVTVIARILSEENSDSQWSKIIDEKISILGGKYTYYPGLKKEINACDKIVVRMPSILGLHALKLNRKIKKPCLIEMVGCAWDALWNSNSIIGKIIAPYMFFQNKYEIKNASYVLYVTDEFLQNRYPTNGKSIGCSDVELRDFDDNVLFHRCQSINQCNEKKVLGTIAATNVKYKGQQDVIKALGKLKHQGKLNYEYQLVGSGNQNFLKGIAKKNGVEEQIKFISGLPHEKIFQWLDTIDIYIQPSRVEGLPRALIEAMSRGLPVIGTNVGGIPEVIEKPYLITNSRGKVNEIVDILENLSKENMIEQAKRNYKYIQKFERKKLQCIRDMFYKEFFDIES